MRNQKEIEEELKKVIKKAEEWEKFLDTTGQNIYHRYVGMKDCLEWILNEKLDSRVSK